MATEPPQDVSAREPPPRQAGDAPVDAAGVDERWRAALGALWQKQSRWSKKADALKRASRSWTGPVAVLGLVGAALSIASVRAEHWLKNKALAWSIIAFAGPVAVAISAALTRELLSPRSEQSWVKARGVAEDLKAEGYIYAAAAPPYSDRRSAPEKLMKKVASLESSALGLGPLPDADAAVTRRHPHAPLDLDGYVVRRVKGQISYHRTNALAFERTLRRWRGVAIVLAVLSAGVGAVATFGSVRRAWNEWVAVVATALATVNTFVYANGFEFLAASYAATAERLNGLIDAWRASADHGAGARDRFVLDCEAVIASQNRSWRDEFSKSVITRLSGAVTT